MVTNSVSGSFRGIEISFSYNGPHIVMSVLNTTDEGRQLRVMFQQQPNSGRVNWTTFQLTGQLQEVVVPSEVFQSYKLAFYVDHHEPIATYTEKIVDELKQIQEKLSVQDFQEVSSLESEQQAPTLEKEDNTLSATELSKIAGAASIGTKPNGNPSLEDSKSALDEEQTNQNENVHAQSTSTVEDLSHSSNQESISESSPLLQYTGLNANGKGNKDEQHVKQKDVETSWKESAKSGSPKHRSNYVGKYIPEANSDLQFKIKVPSLPKSAKKIDKTFISAQTFSSDASTNQRQSFFGNLAGTFGLSFANRKKQFYLQQNQELHERFHADLEKLENDYNNGYGIPLENWDIDSLTEQESAVLLLNLMVNEVSEWKQEAKKSVKTKKSLAKSLETIENELKKTLKHTRGINAPAPTILPDRTAQTDQELINVQKYCSNYLKRFSEKLAALEQNHAEKVRVPAFKRFLLEFVRDKLFPSVAEFSSLKSVQTRLNWFLALIDYELMPIEPGVTKFTPEFHEVKEKRSSELDTDTIVEVVTPGLQLKGGKRVVQNAVVIPAE